MNKPCEGTSRSNCWKFAMKMLFMMLCSCLCVALVHASDFDATAEYRTKRFGSLGLGITLFQLYGTAEGVLAGGSYLSIELGKGKRAQSGALVLHAATLETPTAVGYSFRYFPARPSQHLFYLGKVGVGIYRAINDLGYYQNRPRLNIAAGVGYQWHRHSTVAFMLSQSVSGREAGNGLSAVVMVRGFLW